MTDDTEPRQRSFPVDWLREAAERCGCPDCLHLIAWVDDAPHRG